MTIRELEALLREPPVEYRPAPQWSLNGDLTEDRIREELDQFAAQGCGGLFAHARPGHITGYLTPRWFELWAYAARAAAERGIAFHIYDEFMCPAGHAGGHVVAEAPHVVQRELRLVAFDDELGRPSGDLMLLLKRDADGVLTRAPDPAGAEFAVVCVPVQAGRVSPPRPDLCHPDTVRTFIEVTYEPYARCAGDLFGSTVRFAFCDEPHILASRAGLPFSTYLAREFERDHGYSLVDCVESLVCTRSDSLHVRFDYWWTVNRLFLRNFMQPLHEWCAAHDLLLTGHGMEHEWPDPASHPDTMALLRWMQAPGNDLLGFQFTPTCLADNAIYLMNLKELASVVNQLGREWSCVETCGGGGYETSYAYFKPCEDFTLSFGVNVIDPHLSHESLAGIRKYDWPQTLSDHSPWWRYYRPHADHVTRVSAALSQGREINRVLVLQPTTSAWLYARGALFDKLDGGETEAALAGLRQAHTTFVTALYGVQCDFDLGDEFILEEFGRVEESTLRVGERAYALLVVPPGMVTLNRSTFELLEQYLARGGVVLALGDAPARVQGRESDEARTLADAQTWITCRDTAALLGEIRRRMPPYIAAPSGKPLPAGLCWRRVVTECGPLYFFCNPWPEPLECDAVLEGPCVQLLDTAKGRTEAVGTSPANAGVGVTLALPPRGHALLLCTSEAGRQPETASAPTPVELQLQSIIPQAPNLLYIDYCDVAAYGHAEHDVNTVTADGMLWQWQGFDGNPWRLGHQFNRTLIDYRHPGDSEGKITYRFTIDPALPAGERTRLQIAIERPWLYTVTLNGAPVPHGGMQRWFDEHMCALPVGGLCASGANVLELVARPFHSLCEVAPVYVIGHFAAEPAGRGFVIAAPKQLEPGDWTHQGLPFYADVVRYTFAFTLDVTASALEVTLPQWAGSVARVHVDDGAAATIMHPPYACRVPGPLSAGPHTLRVDVAGNMRNMMGPHHAVGLPGAWTWAHSPQHMPAGQAYRVWASGLSATPLTFALH